MIDEKIRITEIADKACVSPSTVSRVLNHPEKVRLKTLNAVISAMKELGLEYYERENVNEEDLKPNKFHNNIVIFNIPLLESTFFSKIYEGVEASARVHGLSLLIYVGIINSRSLPSLLSLIESTKAIGMITLSQLENDILCSLNKTIPLVNCCEYNEEIPSTFVGFDDRKAATEATEYIISTGHRKIALINGPKQTRFSKHRYEGFCIALEKAGISIPDNWFINLPDIGYDSAHAAISQILSNVNRPNAIFAVSDIYAVAALNVANSLDLNVPEDLIVVGFDNVEIAKMSNPTLSTVSLPCYQIGYTAAELLFEKISNPNELVRSILFDTTLIVRQSSSARNSTK